jgi:dTDP-4-amino-4,6-dideoxygalactose transaminase
MSIQSAAPPRIPFYNFAARYRDDARVARTLVAEGLRSPKPILGRRVEAFERDVTAFLGGGQAVGVASGTGALMIALTALGVGPGSEVIVPAFTFHSPASVPLHLGARIRFADVDPVTGTIDPQQVEAQLTERTTTIVAAHLWSVLADVGRLRAAAERAGSSVLEDSAVAFGMRLDGKPAGLLGHAGTFSFHPAKLLGGIGDAGMVIAADEELVRRCRMLRNHGQDGTQRYVHHLVGFNCRMDDVVAGFLSHRLARYPAALARRAAMAARYTEALAPLRPSVLTPPEVSYGRAFYVYAIRTPARDALRAHLADRGIETRVYYPHPLPLQPAFASLGHRPGEFPQAERLSREALALPLYPEMADEDLEAVIDAVAGYFS